MERNFLDAVISILAEHLISREDAPISIPYVPLSANQSFIVSLKYANERKLSSIQAVLVSPGSKNTFVEIF